MSKSKTTNAKIDNEELKSLLLNGFYNYISGMMGIDANANQDSAVEHFSMNADVEFLRNVLKVLKQEGWVSNKTKDSDWIFRLTGFNLKKKKALKRSNCFHLS